MIEYLCEGWHAGGGGSLRDAVVDGALDSASMLLRAGVPAEAVATLALKVHTVATLTLPSHRAEAAQLQLSDHQRRAIAARLQMYTDRFVALQGFVSDALEHVYTAAELRALYLHLMHVAQMIQLLGATRLQVVAEGQLAHRLPQLDPAAAPHRPAPRAR